VKDNKKDNFITITTKGGLNIAFDKTTGLMTRYNVGTRRLLGEGGTIKPNFWRAVTDNDMGAQLQKKFAAWRNPKMELSDFKFRTENNKAIVLTVFNMPEVQSVLTIEYIFDNQGRANVKQSLRVTDGAKVGNPLRFGLVMELPYNMDRSTYYGRGPIENYIDRKASQNVGIYTQTADEQFFPYIRPQETGTKSDMRWWEQKDAAGQGFRVHAATWFGASALHYSVASLDEGDEKDQRHAPEVPKSKYTELCLDYAQFGLGGENSWGAWPLPQHRLDYKDMTFSINITPLEAK
jgi:beta-galactosidase